MWVEAGGELVTGVLSSSRERLLPAPVMRGGSEHLSRRPVTRYILH